MAWMMGAKAQRWLKGLHVAAAALSTGAVFSLCVLMVIKYTMGDDLDTLTVDVVLADLMNRGFMIPFYAVAATGLAYSLFTEWGFFRSWWIAAKWVGVVILVTVTVAWLLPAVTGMAGLADGYFSIEGAVPLYKLLFRQAAASMGVCLGVFLAAVFLSVFKPWGMRSGWPISSQGVVRWVSLSAVTVSLVLLAAGFRSLERYRNMEIGHVDPSGLEDGVYEGESSDSSFTYRVAVTVEGGLMTRIEAARNRENIYARVAEGVFTKAVNLQSPRADAVTGATTTSKMLLKAVEDALKNGINEKQR